jgi:hypothetical protein
VAKKLKVTETTSQEVISLSRVVEYLFLDVLYADNKISLLVGDSGEIARDYFGKRHEASLRVRRHGEAALEGSGTVSSADPGTEEEGVAAVAGDGWLDED